MIAIATKWITNRTYGISVIVLGLLAILLLGPISMAQSQMVKAQEQQQLSPPAAACAVLFGSAELRESIV
jgi:hypothetical protein